MKVCSFFLFSSKSFDKQNCTDCWDEFGGGELRCDACS